MLITEMYAESPVPLHSDSSLGTAFLFTQFANSKYLDIVDTFTVVAFVVSVLLVVCVCWLTSRASGELSKSDSEGVFQHHICLRRQSVHGGDNRKTG